MGFFDALKKAAKTIDNAMDDKNSPISKLAEQAIGKYKEATQGGSSASSGNTKTVQKATVNAAAKNGKTTDSTLIASGSQPAKEATVFEGIYFDEADGKEVQIKYSFSISGDFIETEIAAMEVHNSFLYFPLSDDKVDYEKMPYLIIVNAAENFIYNAIEAYKNNKTIPEALTFEAIDSGKVYYKAKINYFGQILYMYALDRGFLWKNSYIGVVYNTDVLDTLLEKKLIAAVDQVAATYKEEVLNS